MCWFKHLLQLRYARERAFPAPPPFLTVPRTGLRFWRLTRPGPLLHLLPQASSTGAQPLSCLTDASAAAYTTSLQGSLAAQLGLQAKQVAVQQPADGCSLAAAGGAGRRQRRRRGRSLQQGHSSEWGPAPQGFGVVQAQTR